MNAYIGSRNEWDPLEEVVIGRIDNAQIPRPGIDLHTIEYADREFESQIPSGPFSSEVIAQTRDDLEKLCETLISLGIKVRRPDVTSHATEFGTTAWKTDGFYNYCPRDVLLAIDDLFIETPMVLRARYLEPFAYRSLLQEYFEAGAKWISAPKPQLLDESFSREKPTGQRLENFEPIFDAANILKFNDDILYLVSDSGNAMGARWLQRQLGDKYKVHPVVGVYASTHVDSTIVPLSEGRALLNPSRVNNDNMPEFMRDYEIIWAPEMVDTGFVGDRPYCSVWIGMNLLMLRPGLAVVDDRQIPLMRCLERHGVDVVPLRLTYSRDLGGSFHCVSLDIRRTPVT